MEKKLVITGEDLNVKKLFNWLKQDLKIEVHQKVIEKIKKSRKFLEEEIYKGKKIYGITTGVGALLKESRKFSSENEIKMIKEHALDSGKYVEKEIARATLLILLNQLSSGRGSISLETFNSILKFLNEKVYPIFKDAGSLGASGDLIPLSNLVLCLMEGKVEKNGKEIPSSKIKKINLKAGEAISLINSTAYSAASLSISIMEVRNLLDFSCAVSSLTLETLLSNSSPFKHETLFVKKHSDQGIIGNYIRNFLKGSKLIDSNEEIQDSYSLRCIPQVYASIKSAIDFIEYNVDREINSYSGNPIIIYEKKEILNGGNFHGQYLSLSADLLKIAISNLAFMSERRINKLLNPNLNKNLPAFLSKEKDSIGLMICQYLAAYYTNECRILSTPSSSISISTSADQEDFVSMSGSSVNNLRKSIDCLKYVLSIEALCSYEAVKFRDIKKLGEGTRFVFELLDKTIKGYEIREKIKDIYNNIFNLTEKINEKFGSVFTD